MYRAASVLHHRLGCLARSNILDNKKKGGGNTQMLEIWKRNCCYSWLHDLRWITYVYALRVRVCMAAGSKAVASRLISSMQTDRPAHAHAHMYSTHAPCFSLAEWQHDYCMQSLHYSTALEGKRGAPRWEATEKRETQEEKNRLFVLAHDAGVLETVWRIMEESIYAGWRCHLLCKERDKWEPEHYKWD